MSSFVFFLKQHYEKLILVITLIGSVIVCTGLTLQTNAKTRVDPLAGVSPGHPEIQLLPTPTPEVPSEELDLEGRHSIFNPAQWVMTADGLRKVERIGVDTLEILALKPLNWTVTFRSYRGREDQHRYWFIVEDESLNRRDRDRRLNVFLEPRATDEKAGLSLVNVAGEDPTQPTGFTLTRLADQSTVTLEPESPYTEPKSFLVTIHHPASGKTFEDLAPGDTITLLGNSYTVDHLSLEILTIKNTSTGRETHVEMPETAMKQ